LNLISHLLDQVPYEKTRPQKVKFPERQPKGDYVEPSRLPQVVPQRF
jgi:hypothetical protein